jgi:formylglycine-generating enzyme required for sulfatase activity
MVESGDRDRGPEAEPNARVFIFIVESRRAETIARARRRRLTTLVGVLALLLLGTGAEWWKPGLIEGPLTLPYRRAKDQYYWHVVMKPAVLVREQDRTLAPKTEFSECAYNCPTMVVVPAGSLAIGSPEKEDERPQHEVTFAKPFAVGKFDVTFAEWDACVEAGACPHARDNWGRADRPVTNVTRGDVKLYVG